MILRLLFIALLSFAALGTPAACTEFGVVGGDCSYGRVVCDGMCVDIGSSHEHCGRCNNACPQNEQCTVGVCKGGTLNTAGNNGSGGFNGTSDGGIDPFFPDGSMLLPDGAVLLPDGDVVPPTPCLPPYNSADFCGDCNTQCNERNPFCSPVEGGFGCVSGCEAPLILCDDQCADIMNDPGNCGDCDNVCPTGICEEGECVGSRPGHTVLMCLSFEQPSQAAPQTKLLANALALPAKPQLKILVYDRFASAAVKRGFRQTVDFIAPSASFTVLDDEDSLAARLDPEKFDVFVIYDQSSASTGSLATQARDWAPVLSGYASLGGIVIVLASDFGTAEMSEFIREAGMVTEVSGVLDRTFDQLYNRGASDAISAGVLSPFLGLRRSCVFDTPDMPSSNFTFVVTDKSAKSDELGLPAVIHRAHPR